MYSMLTDDFTKVYEGLLLASASALDVLVSLTLR